MGSSHYSYVIIVICSHTAVLYLVFSRQIIGTQLWRYIVSRGYGGARGVMVIVVGNAHGDTSSNPGPRLFSLGEGN